MNDLASDFDEPSWPSRLAPALFSLFQPGVGQLLNGHGGKGIAMVLVNLAVGLLASNASRTFALAVLFLGVLLLVRVWSVVDAFAFGASRAERAGPWFTRRLACVGLVGVLSVVGLGASRASSLRAFFIPSGSMEPTLMVGDRVIGLRIDPADFRPQRGQILVVRSPENPQIELVERCVAVGGDAIEIRDKDLYINGERPNEPYVVHNDPRTFSRNAPTPEMRGRDHLEPLEVPEGQLFCMGDNRDFAYDSRYWGMVSEDAVRARPLFLYWAKDFSRVGRRIE